MAPNITAITSYKLAPLTRRHKCRHASVRF